jgi:uncharacterized protein YecE (DUF72 family)
VLPTKLEIEAFLEKISPLKSTNKLGAILIQLPPSFTVSEFKNVESFMDEISTICKSSDIEQNTIVLST